MLEVLAVLHQVVPSDSQQVNFILMPLKKNSANLSLLLKGGSVESSSGQVEIMTTNAGILGTSGDIALSTGSATAGNAGMILISSGDASVGSGGELMLGVGRGGVGNGGTVRVTAGETMDEASTGGEVLILAGEGSSTYSIDGGNGGSGTSALLILYIYFRCFILF